jgi:aromatic-L-amino-acid decarboxylase
VRRIAADRFPADEVAIAAAFRVDEISEDGVDAQGLEEIGRGAGREAASAAFLPLGLPRDVRKNFQFLFFGGGGEARDAGKKFGGGFLRGFEAFLIDGQRFAEKGLQGTVDEVDDAGFARASGLAGGNDARGEGFDLARLVDGEDFQRGIAGFRGLMSVFSGGEERGPVCGEPGCARCAPEKLKKIATSGIERVHVPPVVQSIYELGAVASTRKPGGSAANMACMKNMDALLELSPEKARELGYALVEHLLDYQARLASLPVVKVESTAALQAAIWEELPARGSDPLAVVERIEKSVLSSTNHETHPRFFAFVPGPSNLVGAYADFLRTGYNIFAGSWLEGSGPAMVELVTLDWIRKLAGYPETAGGIFLSGGSLANLSALVTARDALLKPEEFSRALVYGSDQTHSSLLRAMRILGWQKRQFRRLASDAAFRVRPEEVRRAIRKDRASGLAPFCVIANAGTTNTGAIDPMAELADVCAEEKVWLHADGAYGAGALFCARGRELLRGIERADSFTLDPHKWLFQPFDCALLMVRNRATLRHAFHVREDEAEYLQDARTGEEEVNLWDYSPELTRPFRALKLWMSLQVFGADAFAAALERTFYLAEYAEKQLRARRNWEITSSAQMAVVTFRYVPRGFTDGSVESARRLDTLNRAIAARMQEQGFALVLTTELRGETVLRLCTINPRTTVDDIARTVEALDEQARKEPGDGLVSE